MTDKKNRSEVENTRTAGSAIGGAIFGASIGGPAGALIGGVIGAVLGESVNDNRRFLKKSSSNDPKIGDRRG